VYGRDLKKDEWDKLTDSKEVKSVKNKMDELQKKVNSYKKSLSELNKELNKAIDRGNAEKEEKYGKEADALWEEYEDKKEDAKWLLDNIRDEIESEKLDAKKAIKDIEKMLEEWDKNKQQ